MDQDGLNYNRSNLALRVEMSTWARTSHDLFDFQSEDVHTKTFNISESAVCYRNQSDSNVGIVPYALPRGAAALVWLIQKDGSYWVECAGDVGTRKHKLWVVVRDSQRLQKDDIIKFGRFRLRVKQLVKDESSRCQPDVHRQGLPLCEALDPKATQGTQARVCRICLLENATEDDPLIAPCQCKGTIEHVHLKCIQQWTKDRVRQTRSNGSYFYRPLSCELCRAQYASHARFSGLTLLGLGTSGCLPVVELPPVKPPFVVLENISRDDQGHHVISLADEKLAKIGRGHSSDIRIDDVSISRWHASIRFSDGEFLLEDNASKFGTSIPVKRLQLLGTDDTTLIQVGRTVLSLSPQQLRAERPFLMPRSGHTNSLASEE